MFGLKNRTLYFDEDFNLIVFADEGALKINQIFMSGT